MIPQIAVPGQQLVQGVGEFLDIGPLRLGVADRRAVEHDVRPLELAVHAVPEVGAEVHAVREAPPQLQLGERRAEQAVARLLAHEALLFTQRVHAQRVGGRLELQCAQAARRGGWDARAVVGKAERVVRQRLAPQLRVGADVGDGARAGDRDADPQPLVGVLEAHRAGVLPIPLAEGDAVLIEVAAGEGEPGGPRDGREAELMALLSAGPQHAALPIRPGRASRMRGLIGRIRGAQHLRQLVGCEHARVARRPAGRFGGGAPLRDRLRSVHHVDEIERALRAILRVVADADGVVGDARRAAPRGDQDDAVRAAAAVHRRRRRVLQDLDGLNRRRVEILDAARQRHAVHDVERSVPRRDRPDASHGHVHRNAGAVAAARHHIHARHPRLDRLHRVGSRDFRNLLRGHRTDGAGQVAALLRAVADDDEALELDRRRDELEVQRGA